VVLLSHWHHDHIEGLHALPFFLPHAEVVVAAPSKSVTGFAARDVLARFGGKPLLATPIQEWGSRFQGGFSIQELEEGENDVLGESVLMIAQPHSDPSAGYRVRDVCYATDTPVRSETAAFARGAAVLLHDAWLDDEGARSDPEAAAVHGTAAGAARIAAEAGVQTLVLAHLNPGYDAVRLERLTLEATAIFPKTFLAMDMMSFKVSEKDEEDEAVGSPSKSESDEPESESPLRQAGV
jgi:ribonuclease BN (tRNA processing enzyme)